MEKNYKLYLFDFDYTLANSETGIVKCFKLLFEQEHYPIPPYDDIKRTIGMSMIDALEVLTGEHNKNLLVELRNKYTVFADLYMTDNTVLFPETREALAKIKTSGAKIGIISSKTRRRIMQTLTRDKLTHLVDFVVGSEDVETFKPSPEGILAALTYFKADKKDVLYIGDNTIDAQAALNAGVDFAAVLTGNDGRENFEVFSCIKIMNNLSQL